MIIFFFFNIRLFQTQLLINFLIFWIFGKVREGRRFSLNKLNEMNMEIFGKFRKISENRNLNLKRVFKTFKLLCIRLSKFRFFKKNREGVDTLSKQLN